jgi:hypothetical protein
VRIHRDAAAFAEASLSRPGRRERMPPRVVEAPRSEAYFFDQFEGFQVERRAFPALQKRF